MTTQIEKKEQAKDVEHTRDLPVYAPATDIYEKKDAILVFCDMPGVVEKGLDITLEDDVLTICGCQDMAEPEHREAIYRGFRPGIYRRSFTLNTPVHRDGIKARLTHGVLEMSLPKAEAAQPRKIQVETAA